MGAVRAVPLTVPITLLQQSNKMKFALMLFVTGLLLVGTTGRPADPSETIEQDDQYVEANQQQEVTNVADEEEIAYDGAGGDGLPDFGGLRPVDVDAGVFPVSEQQVAVPVQNEPQPVVQQVGQPMPYQQSPPIQAMMQGRSLEQYLMEKMDNRMAGLEAQGHQFLEFQKKMNESVASVATLIFFADLLLLIILVLAAYSLFAAIAGARKLQQAEKAAHEAHCDEGPPVIPSGNKLGTGSKLIV